MVYLILMLAGLGGLAVMAALGFVHMPGQHGHHGHGHGHTHGHGHSLDVQHGVAHPGQAHAPAHGHTHGIAAHGHAHGPAHGPAVGATGHGHTHGHTSESNANADGDADGDGDGDGDSPMLMARMMWLLPLLSPLNWFSWFLGAGLVGYALSQTKIGEPWLAVSALAGAFGFNMLVLKPIWKLVFAFASPPAKNLDGCLMQEAEVVTAFNQRGEGLIRLNIDGRTEDVLARLADGERGIVRIRRGDRVLVEEINTRDNSCRVTRV